MSSSPAAFRTTSAKTPTKQQRTPLGQLDVNTNKSMTSHHEECERRLQSAQAEYAKNLQQMRQDFINSELEIEQWQQSYADIQEQGKQLHAAYEIKCIKVKELGGQLEEAKVVLAQQNANAAQMKEELLHAQQFCSDSEAARKELEGDLAEALQRIALMERSQRAMEEEMRSVKMTARLSLAPVADDAQLTCLKEKVARLEDELQKAKTLASAAPLPTANKRVSLDSMSSDELKSNYETLSIRNDLVQEELQRVQATCDRLQDELVRARSDAAAERDSCSTLQSSLSNERAASDALERSLHALQAELSSVYSKLQEQEAHGSSVQRMQQDMHKLQQHANAAADQLKTKELALLEVQRKLADVQSRCEKLQVSCDEAAGASDRHQAALAKQVEANKVLDNDLKLMYRKHKKDTAELEDKYKRDDYGRRYAYAISRLDRCEGLLQEWGSYIQSAASTARSMDEVAAEQKKSESLVARIISAAVQRARSLDSMNQGLAEQLQRARSDIAQLVHERNEHAHGRRAAEEKISDLELLLSRTSAALGSAADDMAAMKGELEQKDDAYARAHDDLYEAACALEDDMSAVYRMLSQLALYDAGATVTAPEYEYKDGAMGAIERCAKLLQHWCSGFESALSTVLNCNREAEATSLLQLQSEIQSRDQSLADLSHQLEQLRATNAGVMSQLAVMGEMKERSAAAAAAAAAAADVHAQRADSAAAEADARCAALETKMEELTKRHEEYAGFIAEECSVKDDLIRDLEAERVVHSSALADLRSSTASLACTMEAVARVLAPIAPDTEQGDVLALSHAAAQLVHLLRSDNSRCDARAQRLQEELNDVLSKETSASRRMMDCDSVTDALRRRVQELQGKLEAEMATAAQLPDALDQVSEATDRCEQLREALTKCEGRLGAALEQVAELQEKAKGMRSPAPAAAFKTCSPSAAAVRIRVDELTAELEGVKRLSAQKQLQDKERVKLLKANLKKSDEEVRELDAVICHCRAVLHSFVEQPQDVAAVTRLLKTISKPSLRDH